MTKVISVIAAAAFATAGASAWAHHSYAMFDFAKSLDVKGTVKEFKYTNPHSFIVLVPQRTKGAAPEMLIEANGPGYLARSGWKRGSLKPGDVVTVTMNPLRDGSPGGNLIKVTFADGRQLTTR